MFLLVPITAYLVAQSWTSTQPTSFANESLKHTQNRQFLQENGPLWFCLALGWLHNLAQLKHGEISTRQRTTGKGSWNDRADRFRANHGRSDFPGAGCASWVRVQSAAQRLCAIHSAVQRRCPRLSTELVAETELRIGNALDDRRPIVGVRGLAYAAISWWRAWRQSLDVFRWVALAKRGVRLLESFTCFALSYGLLVLCFAIKETNRPLARLLLQNAFSVYVFHPPILIVAARVLHELM
jgi:glucans biosynthesis protein C